ncbi:hypothetical protein HKX48_001307 [Thoreauomyces humboldtii]|nr:hypothetical protein HKX48_001307 [Thoreauomyces humboldtii]
MIKFMNFVEEATVFSPDGHMKISELVPVFQAYSANDIWSQTHKNIVGKVRKTTEFLVGMIKLIIEWDGEEELVYHEKYVLSGRTLPPIYITSDEDIDSGSAKTGLRAEGEA